MNASCGHGCRKHAPMPGCPQHSVLSEGVTPEAQSARREARLLTHERYYQELLERADAKRELSGKRQCWRCRVDHSGSVETTSSGRYWVCRHCRAINEWKITDQKAQEGPQEGRTGSLLLSEEERLARFREELRTSPERTRLGDAYLWFRDVEARLETLAEQLAAYKGDK